MRICDDYSDDLSALIEEVHDEGILISIDDQCRNIFYIDSLEMSSSLLNASNVKTFYDMLPQIIFARYSVMPELMVYLVAETDGYYDEAAKNTKLDPSSVDGYSPLLFTGIGYKLSKSGKIIYSETEGLMLPVFL